MDKTKVELTIKQIEELVCKAASEAIKASCNNCEEIAEKAAEKAVSKIGLKVGINLDDDNEVKELKDTIGFGKKQKRMADKVNDTVVKASIGVFVVAIIGMLGAGFVELVYRKH